MPRSTAVEIEGGSLGPGQARVAYLTEKTSIGGGESSLLNLLECMVERGCGPILMCPSGELLQRGRALGVQTWAVRFPDVHLRLGLIPSFSLAAVCNLRAALKQCEATIAHAESLLALYYGGMAARAAGLPFVATYHGYWPLHSGLTRLFVRLFCDRVYPVSEHAARELRETMGSWGDRIRTVSLGYHSSFAADLPERTRAREMLGLPTDRPIVMHFARFQPIKGHLVLLGALEEMVMTSCSIAPLVVFVGGLPEPASRAMVEYKAQVEGRARDARLRRHVLFLGPRDDVALLMRAADVVVSPSDVETFGMALVEAMAVGTPVVATAAGAPAEIIDADVTGVLVPPRNPAALACAIARLLEERDWTRQLADRARALARSRFGPEVRCSRMAAEYMELI